MAMTNGMSLDSSQQAQMKARQGVRYQVLEELTVIDPETMRPVPRDGATMGEVMFRGNIVMKGYLKNPQASAKAFYGGWFHSGDLGVMHPDGYIQLKDRSKDIIISGERIFRQSKLKTRCLNIQKFLPQRLSRLRMLSGVIPLAPSLSFMMGWRRPQKRLLLGRAVSWRVLNARVT